MSAFATGKYRNLFAEIGKTEEEIQKNGRLKDGMAHNGLLLINK